MNFAAPSLTVADWHRLNRLLATALELEGAERTAWLQSLSADDQHLHAVLRDLLTQSEATGFADGATHPPSAVANLAAQALAAMRREQPGDRLGPWQLARLLAEGGMGAVWVAQRVDGVLKRTAALKLPRAEWVDHGLSERIARERAILARLQHPAIAVLYDAGVTSEGRPYLALEYVDGVPIDAYCQGRELNAVLRLFVQVIRAVAYAHGQLVIHRDLKPANVLVTADGLPKLLDFGISKLIEGDATSVDATALTRLAGRPLTLAYAAPEQVLSLPITVAADVYALGVMLFELLTATRLYRATTPRALEEELLRGDLRKPSDMAADKQRAKALKGDLDAIVLTALKRQPGERYQSATALADDLQRYLDGQPVTAQPDSRAYRLRKFVTRNALPVAAGSAVVVALVIGAGIALWQATEARDQAQRATALNSFVLSLIRQADPNASAQTKAADVAMLTAIEERIDKEFKGSPDQLLQLRVTIGEAYKNRGEMSAAQRVFQRAVDEGRPQVPADDLMLLTAQVRGADNRLIVSTASAEQLDSAIDILRGRSRGDKAARDLLLDALLTRFTMVNVYGVPAYVTPEENVKTVNEAMQVAMNSFGAGSRQHLRAAGGATTLRILRQGAAEGLTILDGALAQARERGGDVINSPEYLVASADHAAVLCSTGGVEQGLATLRKLGVEVRAAHGPTSYLLESILIGTADCVNASGESTAFALIEEAFNIAAARERPPSTNLMQRAMDAFDSATVARDFEAAERYYQEALKNAAAIPEEAVRDRLTVNLRVGRACQLVQRGDAEEALRVALPLIATFNAEYAKIRRLTPNQGGIWICLSDAQRQLGQYEDAIQTAATFGERCRELLRFAPKARCEPRALAARALAELDAGLIADAQATVEQRLQISTTRDDDARFAIAFGRVMIAKGRGAEAIDMLRDSYDSWLKVQPQSPHAAETLYWLGRAYQASGDKRGHGMVAEAREALAASPVATHRVLAAKPTP